MPDEKNLERLQDWAGRVACPVCFGELEVMKKHAICIACGRAFPVADGIPVLIADRAVTSPAVK